MVQAQRFHGRVALITGGGAGFGRSTALRLAAEGAKIAVADIIPERATAVGEEIEARGGIALDIGCDVSNGEQCRRMVEEVVGAVVHVSSIGGMRGSTHGLPFQTAKGGLINLTRHMAIAHAKDHIRVNCICPGVVNTPLTEKWLSSSDDLYREVCAWHPMNRIGRPEEIAATVAFLLSDEASFITGAILAIDGGYLAAGRGNP